MKDLKTEAREIYEQITENITDFSDPEYPVADTRLSAKKLSLYLAHLASLKGI